MEGFQICFVSEGCG